MSEHRLREIVIERPRSGWRCSSRKHLKTALNQLTQEAIEEGLLSPYLIKTRHKTKYLSDHLGPLRRYLRSKIGQPWDQVYSELHQNLDKSSVTGLHIISHLWDYVERHVELIDGIPYRKAGTTWGGFRPLDGYRDEFYVHPETGILCAVEQISRRQKPELRDDVIELDAYHQYRKVNEVWFYVTFADLLHWLPCFDVLQKMHITSQDAGQLYHRRIYAIDKRQCGKAELKKIRAKLPSNVSPSL